MPALEAGKVGRYRWLWHQKVTIYVNYNYKLSFYNPEKKVVDTKVNISKEANNPQEKCDLVHKIYSVDATSTLTLRH